MTVHDLLADLSRQGFILAVEGASVRVTPASRLTAELRQAIMAHKPALLDLLEPFEERLAIMHHDGGLLWPDAERLALADVLDSCQDARTAAGDRRLS